MYGDIMQNDKGIGLHSEGLRLIADSAMHRLNRSGFLWMRSTTFS